MAAAAIFKDGHTAVITGGASGIGLALANKCTGAGMKVLVVDYNDEHLAALSASKAGEHIKMVKADVSKREDWEAVKRAVESDLGGQVNLLALNAGTMRRCSWEDTQGFRETMDINLFGVVNGIAALLPLVKQSSGQAAVVITGSKQGITNPPGNAAYNASKAAVRAVAEQLDYDLRGDAHISTHLLVPGWTYTALTAPFSGGTKPAGAWTPEQVVQYLERKMDEGRFYVICPDGDVDEATDKRRMLWSVGDIVNGRPPLTRWRDEWKTEASEWMAKQDV